MLIGLLSRSVLIAMGLLSSGALGCDNYPDDIPNGKRRVVQLNSPNKECPHFYVERPDDSYVKKVAKKGLSHQKGVRFTNGSLTDDSIPDLVSIYSSLENVKNFEFTGNPVITEKGVNKFLKLAKPHRSDGITISTPHGDYVPDGKRWRKS